MQPVSAGGRPKQVKKTRRETFGTTGAKFQRKILSLGQNFGILRHLVRSAGLHPAECRMPPPALWNFTPMVRKVSLHDLLPVLGSKKSNWNFRP